MLENEIHGPACQYEPQKKMYSLMPIDELLLTPEDIPKQVFPFPKKVFRHIGCNYTNILSLCFIYTVLHSHKMQ